MRGNFFYEYNSSKFIVAADYPFYALIMAAMRQADDENLEKLKTQWPDVWEELHERLTAPEELV